MILVKDNLTELAEELGEISTGFKSDGWRLLAHFGHLPVANNRMLLDTQDYNSKDALEALLLHLDGDRAEILNQWHDVALLARSCGDWDLIEDFWNGFLDIKPVYYGDGDFAGLECDITIGGPNVYARLEPSGWVVTEYRWGDIKVYRSYSDNAWNDASDTFERGA